MIFWNKWLQLCYQKSRNLTNLLPEHLRKHQHQKKFPLLLSFVCFDIFSSICTLSAREVKRQFFLHATCIHQPHSLQLHVKYRSFHVIFVCTIFSHSIFWGNFINGCNLSVKNNSCDSFCCCFPGRHVQSKEKLYGLILTNAFEPYVIGHSFRAK